jgi:molecular chaperone GrpE
MSRHSADAHPPAGPVAGEGGPAGDPRSSSTPPSPAPPAGEASTEDAPTSQAAPPAGDAEDASQVQTDLDALIADTQRERDEYLDLAKRTKADFENYRKRIAADLQAAAVRGKAELAPALLDAIDNLARALEAKGIDPHLADPLSDDPASRDAVPEDEFDRGVLLVYRGMCETLRRNQIETVDPRGEKFDPNAHEVLSTVAADGVEPGTVVEVVQKGYRLGEQLIRPARVVVSE